MHASFDFLSISSRMSKIHRILLVLTVAVVSGYAKIGKDDLTVMTSGPAGPSSTASSSATETPVSVATTVSDDSPLSISSNVEANILESEPTTEVSSSSTSTTSTTASNASGVPDVTDRDGPDASAWECPNITRAAVECSCDFPHTLRCTGDRTALQVYSETTDLIRTNRSELNHQNWTIRNRRSESNFPIRLIESYSFCKSLSSDLQAISRHLKRNRAGTISLLDVTVTGISTLPARFLENVALHGLVVSTGELRRVNENAFTALARPLQALGLPNNLLESVPIAALAHLLGLDRLDLSHNKLKTLEADSFRVS